MQRVYVTGIGVVSSIGLGREAFWRALSEGRHGISELELFDTSRYDRHVACEVKRSVFDPRDHLSRSELGRMGRASAFAVAAARMAVEEAGLSEPQLRRERASVVLGTTMGEANLLGEMEHRWIHGGDEAIAPAMIPRYGSTLLPIHVARAFGVRGLVQTLPAACAAGNYAIGTAADLIRSGRADVVLTGATEVIERLQFAGFVRLGAMAPEKCQPFDKNRRGLLIGEGAAIFVLESDAHAEARGATPIMEVGGHGLACDAFHITRPHPEGEGNLRAMREALRASGIAPSDVDHVNAHGTGTHANDPIETRVLKEVFGGRTPPVTSIKSAIGHCMGAASALEAAACAMTLQTGTVPPTLHYETPDPDCDVDLVANAARALPRAEVVLNNSLAFGGYDAVVCFARPGVLPPPEERGRVVHGED